jgi:uncharacterized protein (DUF58 family)
MESALWDPELFARAETLEWKSRVLVEGFLQGLHRSRLRGFSSEFSQYQPYIQGDDLRYVDWRAYGRLDRLYIRQFEAETNLRCQIFIDCSASMAYGSDKTKFRKYDYALLLAAALMRLLQQQHDAFGLTLATGQIDEHIPQRVSRVHFFRCLSALEKKSPGGSCLTGKCLHQAADILPKRGLVFLFSDGWDELESFTSGLERLRYDHHDVCFIQTVDPQEIDFSFSQSDLFEDMETGVRLPITPDWNRKSYLSALELHQKTLAKQCLDLGISHFLARTDQPPFQALAAMIARRESQL